MISESVRKLLTAASWLLIILGPVLTAFTLIDVASTPGGFLGGALRGALGLSVGLVTPVVTGGVLLVLLSIDKRLEARG